MEDEGKVLDEIEKAESAEQVLGILLMSGNIPDDFFDDTDFNPFVLWKDSEPAATQGQSIIKKLNSWKTMVDTSVDLVIDKYHYGFNSSTRSFSNILEVFTQCQEDVQEIENTLQSKRLQSTQTSQIQKQLKDLWFQQRVYNNMIDIMDKIEYLTSVPPLLDELSSRRQFLHAVRVIQAAINLLVSPRLSEVDALSEIRKDLLNRRNVMQEMLIEELHNHIYFKKKPESLSEVEVDNGKSTMEAPEKGTNPKKSDSTIHSRVGKYHRKSPSRNPGRARSTKRKDQSFKSITSSAASPSKSPGTSPQKYRSFSPSPSSPQALVENSKRYDTVMSSNVNESSSTIGPGSSIRIKLQIATILSFENEIEAKMWNGQEVEGSETENLYTAEESDEYLSDPEGDSELYMALLVEALFKLNRLPSLVTTLSRRLSKELRRVLDDVQGTFKQEVMSASSDAPRRHASSDDHHGTKSDSELLVELMDRTFKTFTSILKHHQLVLRLIFLRDKKAVGSPSSMLRLSEIKGSKDTKGSNSGFQDSDDFPTSPFRSQSDLLRPSKKEGDSEYSVNFVWDTMQRELCALLLEFLQVRRNSVSMQLADSKALDLEIFKFSFEAASVPSLAKVGKAGSRNIMEKRKFVNAVTSIQSSKWIHPSPYLITSMYRPIMEFTDLAYSMIGLHSVHANPGILRGFVSNFVQESFLPRVKRDCNFNINEIFMSSSSFAIRDQVKNPSQKEPRGLLTCVYSIAMIVERLFADFFLLPYDIVEFIEVVKSTIAKFHTKCQEKLGEVTKSTFTSILMNEGDLLSILKREPVTQESLPGVLSALPIQLPLGGMKNFLGSPSSKSKLNEDEILERELVGYIREHKDAPRLNDDTELIWEQSSLGLLASMTESLVWLKNCILELCEPLSAYQAKSDDAKGDKEAIRAAEIPSILTDSLQQLADRCLYALKIEFICHSLYFLSNLRNSSYYCDDEPSKPDKFIADLNKDLMRGDEKLSRYLSVERKKFVFKGLPYVLGFLIIDGLSKLADKRVNRFGLHKMQRNIFALQQTLTNILTNTADTASAFDKARMYWEILFEENTQDYAKQHPEQYSFEEYRQLQSINVIQEKRNHAGSLFG